MYFLLILCRLLSAFTWNTLLLLFNLAVKPPVPQQENVTVIRVKKALTFTIP